MFKKGITSHNLMFDARRGCAFTLNELHVEIVILALLMAVLNPAVQIIRGRSRNPRKCLPR